MTEYRFYRAGRIDTPSHRQGDPRPDPRFGLRIGVGVRGKLVEIELTRDEALKAAADLITAVRVAEEVRE